MYTTLSLTSFNSRQHTAHLIVIACCVTMYVLKHEDPESFNFAD